MTRRTVSRGLVLAAGVLAAAPVESRAPQAARGLSGFDLDRAAEHWRLPRRLREISGLALTADGRLLAHHDEAAVVFELDLRTGAVVKEFQLAGVGGPVRDDFEGIAAAEERLYLITSDGRLYEFREGAAGESVLFTMYATGAGRRCEIEGLAHDPGRRALLLVCKQSRGDTPEDRLEIHVWPLERRRLDDAARIVLDAGELATPLGERGFHPSGIELHPESGHYFVVAARQRLRSEKGVGGRTALEFLPVRLTTSRCTTDRPTRRNLRYRPPKPVIAIP